MVIDYVSLLFHDDSRQEITYAPVKIKDGNQNEIEVNMAILSKHFACNQQVLGKLQGYRITHIPSGHALGNLLFDNEQLAQEFAYYWEDRWNDYLDNPAPTFISVVIKDRPKLTFDMLYAYGMLVTLSQENKVITMKLYQKALKQVEKDLCVTGR